MALAYVAAGVNHFVHPATYRAIMPPWLPAHGALVAASGAAEILLGLGLLLRPTRRAAAWGIVVLLVAVFPANIQMAVNWWREGHPKLWIALLRLPLQLVLVWWALRYTRAPQPE
ncbi:MAG: DoxX family protein [Chitinophagaceae bacterium]|nr:MAG: DoxX family protein [Chitinophagaceae bacterium]